MRARTWHADPGAYERHARASAHAPNSSPVRHVDPRIERERDVAAHRNLDGDHLADHHADLDAAPRVNGR